MRNVVLRGALLSLVILALGVGPASAHAVLTGTDPEDGASLSVPPTSITFTFNENIGTPAFVVVRAPDGSKVKVSDVAAVDHTVTGTLAPSDQKGRYSASYRVVSADGHVVEGAVHFTTTTGRTVKQVDSDEETTFVHRHSAHFFWGILAAAVAVALLLAPLRRRDDQDDA